MTTNPPPPTPEDRVTQSLRSYDSTNAKIRQQIGGAVARLGGRKITQPDAIEALAQLADRHPEEFADLIEAILRASDGTNAAE
jgi:hypothetical protein